MTITSPRMSLGSGRGRGAAPRRARATPGFSPLAPLGLLLATVRTVLHQALRIPWRSYVRDLPYSMYCSSLIIGAGALSLPVLSASVGLLPALGATAVLGLLVAVTYVRIAQTIHDYVVAEARALFGRAQPVLRRAGLSDVDLPVLTRDLLPYLAGAKGIGLLDDACAWVGLGRAGKFALLVGLTAYIGPACIGYATVGGKTLVAIAAEAMKSQLSPAIPLLVGMAFAAASLAGELLPRHFRGRAALCAILQMVSGWAGTSALVMLLLRVPALAAVIAPLAVTLFVAVTAATIARSARVQEGSGAGRGGLLPAHLIGVVIAVVELVLLVATGFFAWWVLSQQPGEVQLPPPVDPASLGIGVVANTFGVLLFAYTGTGIFNLVSYPHLFVEATAVTSGAAATNSTVAARSASGRPWGGPGPRLPYVVAVGTLIPALMYLGWTLVVALGLRPEALLEADRAMSYPTIPLAEKVAGYGGAGWMVAAAGYFVALLAVTGACTGFSESLADRLARVGQAARGERSTAAIPPAAAVRAAQYGVLLLATAAAVALAVLPPKIPFGGLLTVAGNAGGGLLLLVLPFFLGTRGRTRPPKRDIVVATFFAAALFGMNLTVLPADTGRDLAAAVIAAAIIAIDLAFLGAFGWLVLSEPAERTPVPARWSPDGAPPATPSFVPAPDAPVVPAVPAVPKGLVAGLVSTAAQLPGVLALNADAHAGAVAPPLVSIDAAATPRAAYDA